MSLVIKLGHPFTSESPKYGFAVSGSTGIYSLASVKFAQGLCSTTLMPKWLFISTWVLTQLKGVKPPGLLAKPKEIAISFYLSYLEKNHFSSKITSWPSRRQMHKQCMETELGISFLASSGQTNVFHLPAPQFLDSFLAFLSNF